MKPTTTLTTTITSRSLAIFIATFAAITLLISPKAAIAQESTNVAAATQPGGGLTAVRQQFRLSVYDDDPTGLDRKVTEWTSWTRITHGLRGDLALSLDIPLTYSETSTRSNGTHNAEFGVDDIQVGLKWRVWQHNPTPIDTTRLALTAGLSVPTYDSPFSNRSFNPSLGAVITNVRGRHGFNLALNYEFTTGAHHHPLKPGDSLSDVIRYDASYLYRLSPMEYTAETHAAWYLQAEFLGNAETNGDNELFFAPGILYEARDIALELSIQIPVYQDLSERPERAFTLVIGARWLF